MYNYKTNIENGTLVGFANGINICANAVKGTIGKGSNVIIQHENYPYYICTKDAFSVIQSIKLENPIENQAVLMLKDATDSQNKRSRDGRTAMTLIADSILQESIKSGKSPAKINKEITELLPKIEDLILEQKKSISVDKIYKVAQTASDSERIGKLLGEIYKKVGKDGIIHVEGSGTWNDSVQYIEGTRFNDAGFISPYMVHDELAKKEGKKEYKAIYEKPLILVTKRKVEKVSDISPLIDLAIKENKALVIFTDDMESTIASNIVATHRAGIAKLLIVRSPTLWKNLVYEDFAKVVGATVIEESSGKNFKNLTFEDLGICDKIIVDKEETVVIGGQDITEHINELKTRGDNDSQIRLMWLTTKTAILKLGANNEGELSFLRLKTEDAVHSSRLALIDGVVEGAG
jgi:chaperonin GroEL